MQQPTDDELLAVAMQGNANPFGDLYERHLSSI